jgi:predicted glycoside hydrolase/deacetylase ChbG (UPF0249 family)
MRLLVVNADDFGLDCAVNAAVAQAHTQGVLTSASLLVTGPAATEAIELARRHPRLGVGIHLCLVQGRSAISNEPFPDSVLRLRGDVEAELRAQIERFLATGLPPTHLDSHMHAHMHPRVLRVVIQLAREYNIRFVRAPVERLAPSLRCGQRHLARRLSRWTLFATMGAACRRRLRRAGVRTADQSLGVLDPGQLTEDVVVAHLERMPVGLTEIFFHPATVSSEHLQRCQRGYQHAEELRALCSSGVREVIERRHIRVTNFGELANTEP